MILAFLPRGYNITTESCLYNTQNNGKKQRNQTINKQGLVGLDQRVRQDGFTASK